MLFDDERRQLLKDYLARWAHAVQEHEAPLETRARDVMPDVIEIFDIAQPLVRSIWEQGWAACRDSEFVGEQARDYAWDQQGEQLVEQACKDRLTQEDRLTRMRSVLQAMQSLELPEPDLGYLKTDKSNQPAFSATQLREIVSAITLSLLEVDPALQFPGADEAAGRLVLGDLRQTIFGAPSLEAAHNTGATGSPAIEAERLSFEAWMAGHCWAVSATWDGTSYRGSGEERGFLDPRAVNTRQLWAAWRDRAALSRKPLGE